MASPVSLISVLSSALASQNAGMELGIATLKKTNDVAKLEGELLVQMLENSRPSSDGLVLDIYA